MDKQLRARDLQRNNTGHVCCRMHVKLLLLNSCTLVVTSPCWTTQSFLPSIVSDVGENKENNIVTIIGIESRLATSPA